MTTPENVTGICFCSSMAEHQASTLMTRVRFPVSAPISIITHNQGESKMTRIYEDQNGVAVNAISRTADGEDVTGNLYQVLAGTYNIDIKFQMGNPKETGVNGVTNESLLVILINRLEHLNSRFRCDENEDAIASMKSALESLESRTKARINRGVEGLEVA